MTITSNCDTITITGTIITDFISQYLTSNVEVMIRPNCCCDQDSEFFIWAEGAFSNSYNQSARTFTVTPEDMGLEANTEFPNGVLHVLMTGTSANGDYSTEKACHLLDCDLKCAVQDKMYQDKNSIAMSLFNALQWVEDCADCECQKACAILDSLLIELQDTSNVSIYSGC